MDPIMRSGEEVTFIYTPAINYAFQQNHVPTIRELTITNQGETDWKDISIMLSSEPDFAEVWKAELAFLGPEQSQIH